MPCPECETAVAHCHGALIVHTTGELECTEAGCSGRFEVHAWEAPCADVLGGCPCEGAPTAEAEAGERFEVRSAA